MQSHAFVPTPILLDDDRIRVFVAFLDSASVGRIGYVDVRADDPRTVLGVSERPGLDVGRPGAFDDNGVTPMSAVRDADGRLRLYYTGWQLSYTVRYLMLTGLAISDDDGESFARVRDTPVLERNPGELITRTAAFVLPRADAWSVWYAGGSGTTVADEKQVPTYSLRYLESPDGIVWDGEGEVVLTPKPPDEYGFGRPCVVPDGDAYEMWYSVRTVSKGYRLGYARSVDGRRFVRADTEVGIDVSPDGWDSRMLCFGYVIDTKWGRYMFYNGNNYGETGFGVARWEPR
jgi:hypothetical protein